MKRFFDLTGQVNIVTGGFGLIGTRLVQALLECGSTVVVLDIKDDENKMALFKRFSSKVSYQHGDITNVESIRLAVQNILHLTDKIDGLINNAYPKNPNYGRKFEDVELKDWNENINLHLGGYFNITHQVSAHMKKQRSGTIINMGSIYGMVGPHFSIYEGTKMTMPAEYAAIKGGLINFTRYLATHLAPHNIRVNSVSPGGIFDDQDQKFVEQYEKLVPLGRMGEPDDVCGAILFLASPASAYITGQNIAVDGGWTAW